MEKKKIAFLSYRALHDKCDCRIGFDSFKGVDVFTTDYVYIKHEAKERNDYWDGKNIRIKDTLLRLLHFALKEKLDQYNEVYVYLGRGPLIPEIFTWGIYNILGTLVKHKIKARIVGRFGYHKKDVGEFFKKELSDRFNKKLYPSLDLKWIELPGGSIEPELISLIDKLIEESK